MLRARHFIVIALFALSALAGGCSTTTMQGGTASTIGTTTVRSPDNWVQKREEAKLQKMIEKHARENGVPVQLAHAVITIESRYNPRARGRAGEVGLMQIKPATARGIGYRGPIKALYDPDTNLKWGMKYLGEAHRRGGGSICGTVLKYNAGHYAKRMNKRSAAYCSKVKRIIHKV
jgi:soluble lytic murein transglycosylase-like protein